MFHAGALCHTEEGNAVHNVVGDADQQGNAENDGIDANKRGHDGVELRVDRTEHLIVIQIRIKIMH